MRFFVDRIQVNKIEVQGYEKNGFVPLYKTGDIEKQYYDIPQDEHLKTHLSYFDWKNK